MMIAEKTPREMMSQKITAGKFLNNLKALKQSQKP
jgi:hypothetical protein